jgi:serine/threonine-protein kinase
LDRVFDSSTGEEPSLDEEPKRPSVDDAKDLGKEVAGKYVLRRLIGKGGMGAVFEAEHVELGKRVAIKLMRAVHARGSEAAARFRREARAASAVDSEHIVDVFDVGEDPDLGLFMVMELLDGEDLGALLRRVGRLEPTLALAIARQAALALEKAHAAGVVHRDLKPENVFLRSRDLSVVVKLVDFGVAKLLRDVRERASGGVTRAGAVLGTPSYMSPEQAIGLPDIDHRTDLYSLGALLYEMLVGEPAYPQKATYEMTIVSIATEEPPRVSSRVAVMPELDELVVHLMSRDPGARPASAADVAAAIDDIEPRAAARRLSRPALERGSFSDVPPAPQSSRGVVPAVTGIRAAPPLELERPAPTPAPPKPEPPRTLALFGVVLFALAAVVWLVLRGGPPATPKPTSTPSATPSATSAPSATTTASAAPVASSLPLVAPASAAVSASAAPSAAPPASASAPRAKPLVPAPRPSGQVGGAGITNEF